MTNPVINIPSLYRLQMIELAIFNSANFTSSFQGMNLAANYVIYSGDGFQAPIKMLKIYNGSTVGFTMSLDKVTQHDYFPPGATFILDIQANHSDNSAYGSGTLNGAQGQILYGKGSAGTGNIYISGYL